MKPSVVRTHPLGCMWPPINMYTKVEGSNTQSSVSGDWFNEYLTLYRYIQCLLEAKEERGHKR